MKPETPSQLRELATELRKQASLVEQRKTEKSAAAAVSAVGLEILARKLLVGAS
jgi:hypothetical protein